MFGEVTGKSKDQLKAELWKMRLKRAKRHIPAIVGGMTTIAAAVLAEYYHRRVVYLETIDPDAWPTIEVTPNCMKDVKNGATLMYREFSVGPNSFYSQMTTLDEFPDEANEEFDKYKKSAPVTPED